MDISAAVIFLQLILSGDVELNPGPKEGHLTPRDLKTVRTEIWEARLKWCDIGIELELNKSDLDTIQQNYTETNKCFNEMLCEWLKRIDLQPNWSSLVNALSAPAVGLGHLAEKVKIKHVRRELTPVIGANEPQCIEKSPNSNRQANVSSVVAGFSFPHINEVSTLDDGQKMALEQRLRDESQEIMLKFCTLLDRFLDSLEDSNIKPKRLVRYLKKPLKVLDPDREMHDLESPASIDDIQSIIEDNSSFIDFRLLEHMINLAGTEENKEDLKKYKDDFECYAQRRIYECPANFGPSITANHEGLIVKRDAKYNECKVSELQHFQAKLSQILQIPLHVLIIRNVEKGCIRMAFLIPQFYLKEIFPLSIGQESAIADSDVILLVCGDYHFPKKEHDQKEDNESDKDSSGSPPPVENELSVELQPALIGVSKKRSDSIDADSAIGTSIWTAPPGDDVSICSEDTMELFINDSHDIDNLSSETALSPTSDNALFKASLRGNLEKVKHLVEKKGYNPLQFSTSQHTSLHYAARGGNLNILKYFIEERGCMHSPEDHQKQIPLHVAARYGHFEVVKYFVGEQIVDPTNLDSCSKTALDYATIKGDLAIVKFLIKEMAKYMPIATLVQNKSVSSYTPLHIAAQHGHANLIKFFLTETGCNPNIRGKKRRHILHEAARKGHDNVVRCIAKTLPNCNITCLDKNKDTPLHLVAANGNLKLTKLLTQELESVTTLQNKFGYTPLHLAVINGQADIVKHLVSDIGCDPEALTNIYRRTSLHLAAQGGFLDIVKYFVLERKCQQMTEDVHGMIPAELARKKGYLEIARFLNCSWINGVASKGDLVCLQWFVLKHKYDPDLLAYDELTPLNTAIANGHLDIAKYLIDNDICDPMSRDSNNNTALHIAAKLGHLSVLKILVFNLNCDPNVIGYRNKSPLHFAAIADHLDIIKYLIEKHRCNPACMDDAHCTPLHYASLNGYLEVVAYLTLERGCDPTQRSKGGLTCIDLAAYGGAIDVVNFFISVLNCNPYIHGSTENTYTPLHLAAKGENINVMEYLIHNQHCNPSSVNCNKCTPLHCAAMAGKIKAVKYLYEKESCDPSSKDGNNRTPLMYAAHHGHLHIVKYLVKKCCCNPNLTDSFESMALHLAARYGQLEIVKYLTLEEHCDPTIGDADIDSSLHCAVVGGHIAVLKFLASTLKCDVNIKGWKSRTPLHYAAESGHLNILQYLINEHGCDYENTDSDQATLLHFAAARGHIDVVTYLVTDLKINPHKTDIYDNTPLHEASRNGHLDIVKFFVETLLCNTDIIGSCSMTPLQWALFKGHFHVVQYLHSQ